MASKPTRPSSAEIFQALQAQNMEREQEENERNRSGKSVVRAGLQGGFGAALFPAITGAGSINERVKATHQKNLEELALKDLLETHPFFAGQDQGIASEIYKHIKNSPAAQTAMLYRKATGKSPIDEFNAIKKTGDPIALAYTAWKSEEPQIKKDMEDFRKAMDSTVVPKWDWLISKREIDAYQKVYGKDPQKLALFKRNTLLSYAANPPMDVGNIIASKAMANGIPGEKVQETVFVTLTQLAADIDESHPTYVKHSEVIKDTIPGLAQSYNADAVDRVRNDAMARSPGVEPNVKLRITPEDGRGPVSAFRKLIERGEIQDYGRLRGQPGDFNNLYRNPEGPSTRGMEGIMRKAWDRTYTDLVEASGSTELNSVVRRLQNKDIVDEAANSLFPDLKLRSSMKEEISNRMKKIDEKLGKSISSDAMNAELKALGKRIAPVALLGTLAGTAVGYNRRKNLLRLEQKLQSRQQRQTETPRRR